MTEERRMIQESARDFAMKEVLPLANRLDPEKGDMPPELLDKMAELGYFGIVIPEEYGGLGLGVFEYCLIAEELARAWMSVACVIARGNGLSAGRGWPTRSAPISCRAWRAASSWAPLRCPSPTSARISASVACRARATATTGSSPATNTGAPSPTAPTSSSCWRAPRDAPDPKRQHVGMSSFLIEKPRGSFRQGCRGSPIPKIGYFGWKTWELAFDDCRIPAALIGEEGKAFYCDLGAAWKRARAHTAARAIGSRAARSKTRPPTPRSACSSASRSRDFQAIRFKLAQHGDRDRGGAPAHVLRLRRDRPAGAATRKPRW